MLNGRVYPDTIAPNSPIDLVDPLPPYIPTSRDANGDLIPPQPLPGEDPGIYDHLQYQPYSSLVRCNAGERVLLRFANLGFMQASMTLTGIQMYVVGKDATPLRGRDGTDFRYRTNTVSMGAGEAYDAIFTAPAFQGPGTYDPSIDAYYDTYLLYNRSYSRSDNLSPSGFGGRMTEVRVFPADTLGPQTLPNT